ncbi:ankyrin repeat domain-containing protein [Candidatus Dependentiae bacterium]|nr:ankyrin repeat domain-containing protein [Candidatus Dependentiae bacterium]
MKLINIIGASLVLSVPVGRAMESNVSVNEQLFDAVKSGNCPLVQELLTTQELSDNGMQVDIRNKKNHTLLYVAAKNGHVDLVQLLLAKSAHIDGGEGTKVYDECDIYEYDYLTPLHAAARKGHLAIVTLLLNAGANVNALIGIQNNDPSQDDTGWTALHEAAQNGHLDVIRLLLVKGAVHIDRVTEYSEYSADDTPLHLAAHKGHGEVVQFLLDNGADLTAQNGMKKTPLQLAFENNQAAIVDLLINHHASDVNNKGIHHWAHIHGAAVNGNVKLIEFLLAKGLEINAQDGEGHTPLSYAMHSGSQLGINILLSYGASIPQGLLSNSTLKKAQDNKIKLLQATRFKTIAQLLSTGAYAFPVIQMQVDKKRRKLFKAIENNNVQAVTKLLKEGFTLNACDKEGNSLLHKAIESKSLQVINLLLSLGAHIYIDKPNKQGFTPLQLLVSKGLLAFALSPREKNDQAEHTMGAKRKHNDN